jgi:hypothetical protein
MARFQVGNPGSPGRPPKSVEDRALNMLREVCDEDRLRQLCEKLVSDAVSGKYRSMELLFGYLIGKPVARIEKVGGNAIEEAMQRWKEMQAQSEQQEIEQMYGEPENAT